MNRIEIKLSEIDAETRSRLLRLVHNHNVPHDCYWFKFQPGILSNPSCSALSIDAKRLRPFAQSEREEKVARLGFSAQAVYLSNTN